MLDYDSWLKMMLNLTHVISVHNESSTLPHYVQAISRQSEIVLMIQDSDELEFISCGILKHHELVPACTMIAILNWFCGQRRGKTSCCS